MSPSNRSILAGLFMSLLSGSASAVVIFESLPAGNTFDPPHFVSIDDDIGAAPVDLDWAFKWTAGITAVVTGIDAALSLGDAFGAVAENTVTVRLHADNAGLPGVVIDTYTFAPLTSETVGGAVESGASSSNPLLTAGTMYWISHSAGIDGNGQYSQVGFHLNDQGASGANADRTDNGGWVLNSANGTLPAFRVSGVAVPEPSALVLLAGGLVLVGWARRH